MSALPALIPTAARKWAEELRANREKRELDKALADHRYFKVPALDPGQIEFLWSTDCVVDIVCHLAYSPAEGDGWHLPRHEADCTLVAAYVRGVDIIELLSQDQCREVECKAMERNEERLSDMDDDAAEARHQDRLDRFDAAS